MISLSFTGYQRFISTRLKSILCWIWK